MKYNPVLLSLVSIATSSITTLRDIARHLVPLAGPAFRRRTALVALGTLCAVASDFAISAFLGLYPEASNGSVPGLLLAWLLAAGILRGLGIALFQYYRLKIETAASSLLRDRLIDELAQGEAQAALTPSRVQSLFHDTFRHAGEFCREAATVIAYALQATALLTLLLWMTWRETLALLALFGLLAIVLSFSGRRAHENGGKLPSLYQAMTATLDRLLGHWVLIRMLRTAEREQRAFRATLLDYDGARAKLERNVALSLVLLAAFGGLLLVLTLEMGRRWFATPLPALIPFVYLFVRLTQCANNLALHVGAARTLRASFLSAIEFLRAPVNPRATPTRAAAPSALVGPPSIELRNLKFQYAPQSEDLYDGLSLELPAGKLLGVEGTSGSGKSTLLRLLCGIETPTSGSVLVGGKDAKAYFAAPHRRVGFVGAEPLILEASVLENLCYGLDTTPDTDEIEAVLHSLALWNRIRELPGGLAFRLGRGDELSTGEKQRLNVARALLARPEVLFLDEPAAHLDPTNGRRLGGALAAWRDRATIVLISHKLSMIEDADVRLQLGAKICPQL